MDDYTRGTSENCEHNKLKEGREESVIDLIQQFTTVEAHYVRADSDYCYLPANLNISKMYSVYEQWCRSSNPPKKAESYDFYRRTFNTNFNWNFTPPKKINVMHVNHLRILLMNLKQMIYGKNTSYIWPKKRKQGSLKKKKKKKRNKIQHELL